MLHTYGTLYLHAEYYREAAQIISYDDKNLQ